MCELYAHHNLFKTAHEWSPLYSPVLQLNYETETADVLQMGGMHMQLNPHQQVAMMQRMALYQQYAIQEAHAKQAAAAEQAAEQARREMPPASAVVPATEEELAEALIPKEATQAGQWTQLLSR